MHEFCDEYQVVFVEGVLRIEKLVLCDPFGIPTFCTFSPSPFSHLCFLSFITCLNGRKSLTCDPFSFNISGFMQE